MQIGSYDEHKSPTADTWGTASILEKNHVKQISA